MKRLLIIVFLSSTLMTVARPSFSQDGTWKLVDGKAMATKTLALPGKDAHTIYQGLSRWLVQEYQDPEENIKARVHDEYLRCAGYREDFVKMGNLTGADLQYTFVAEITPEKLTLSFQGARLIYSQGSDDRFHPVEDYLRSHEGNVPHGHDAEAIAAALNEYTGNVLRKLEEYFTRIK
jgi:hypothetical protein